MFIFPFTWGHFILPTDDFSIIFQRGRAQPPTRWRIHHETSFFSQEKPQMFVSLWIHNDLGPSQSSQMETGWELDCPFSIVVYPQLAQLLRVMNYVLVGGFKHEFYFPSYMGCHPFH